MGEKKTHRVAYYGQPRAARTEKISKATVVGSFEDNVDYIVLNPTMTRLPCNESSRGIILGSYGSGNVPEKYENDVKYYVDRGVPVVIVSQCRKGETSEDYEAGDRILKAGAFIVFDMTPEMAIIKLSWVLSQEKDMTRIKDMMLFPIADEIRLK